MKFSTIKQRVPQLRRNLKQNANSWLDSTVTGRDESVILLNKVPFSSCDVLTSIQVAGRYSSLHICHGHIAMSRFDHHVWEPWNSYLETAGSWR